MTWQLISTHAAGTDAHIQPAHTHPHEPILPPESDTQSYITPGQKVEVTDTYKHLDFYT